VVSRIAGVPVDRRHVFVLAWTKNAAVGQVFWRQADGVITLKVTERVTYPNPNGDY
jgi:hypothetical protein